MATRKSCAAHMIYIKHKQPVVAQDTYRFMMSPASHDYEVCHQSCKECTGASTVSFFKPAPAGFLKVLLSAKLVCVCVLAP